MIDGEKLMLKTTAGAGMIAAIEKEWRFIPWLGVGGAVFIF